MPRVVLVRHGREPTPDRNQQPLVSGAVFPNQAFRLGCAVYGFQFHPEATRSIFARWQKETAFCAMGGSQTRDEQDRLCPIHDPRQAEWLETFLNHWLPGESG